LDGWLDGWMDGWMDGVKTPLKAQGIIFPGKARNDKNVNLLIEIECKSLWIKASAKCIHVSVKLGLSIHL